MRALKLLEGADSRPTSIEPSYGWLLSSVIPKVLISVTRIRNGKKCI